MHEHGSAAHPRTAPPFGSAAPGSTDTARFDGAAIEPAAGTIPRPSMPTAPQPADDPDDEPSVFTPRAVRPRVPRRYPRSPIR
ncbi:hypothetical protein ACFQ3Z_11135 [Streptomyces nogalater]